MLNLYSNIKSRRLELRLTQSELAEKLGYSDKSAIAKIESGKVDLQQSKIVAFAKALETTPSILMGWSDEIQPIPSNGEILLSNYRKLNKQGQEYIDDQMSFALSQSKFMDKSS